MTNKYSELINNLKTLREKVILKNVGVSALAVLIAFNMLGSPKKTNATNEEKNSSSQELVIAHDKLVSYSLENHSISSNLMNDYNFDGLKKYDFSSINESKAIEEEPHELTLEEKREFLCGVFDVTDEELDKVFGGIFAEAQEDSIEDTVAVACTVFNRSISKVWVQSTANAFGINKDDVTIYDIFTAPSQFSVISDGRYKLFLGITEGDRYEAVLNYFYDTVTETDKAKEDVYNEESYHNFLSFRANGCEKPGRVKFSSRGNNYFSVLDEEDIIPLEERSYYQNMLEIEDDYGLTLK